MLIADNNNGIFRFGDSGRSVITGPGIQNFDFALLKVYRRFANGTLRKPTFMEHTLAPLGERLSPH